MSLRHRHGYPAALHRGLPAGVCRPTQKFPDQPTRRGRTAPEPISTRFEPVAVKRRKHRFLTYSSSSRSPDPHHLAVLARPGFVGAAPTLTRHLPDRATPSYTALLRQGQR